ncbi:uncharacterized protein LOC122502416 [Leptopilina heterotoma]|uniref:uncharacterized protein LOC122502416 n=1 Tax=Leptopilina heterotoma TaxID=63436 RepID=UPI001CA7F34E|nr:uncharacterized protein LOC122502416 [Leptopilina heterotoma]
MDELLNIPAAVNFDESIAHYEIHAHQPYASSSFNNSDEIRIAVQHQDLCILPSKSSLHIFGRLAKNDGITLTENVNLSNNALSRHVAAPKRRADAILVLENGYFHFTILLSMIFGFAKDYKKIVMNAKHELILTRARSDKNAIFQTGQGGDEEFKIFINKIEWMVPYVLPADNNKIKLLKFIEKDPLVSNSKKR